MRSGGGRMMTIGVYGFDEESFLHRLRDADVRLLLRRYTTEIFDHADLTPIVSALPISGIDLTIEHPRPGVGLTMAGAKEDTLGSGPPAGYSPARIRPSSAAATAW